MISGKQLLNQDHHHQESLRVTRTHVPGLTSTSILSWWVRIAFFLVLALASFPHTGFAWIYPEHRSIMA